MVRRWLRSGVLATVMGQQTPIEGVTRTKAEKEKMMMVMMMAELERDIEIIAIMGIGGKDDELARTDWSGMK